MHKNFENFMSFYKSINHNFKVICLTETWCHEGDEKNSILQIPNYSVIHQVRSQNKKGGGVCMYIHNSLPFKVIEELSETNDANETLTIEIINKDSKNIIISLVYRPPGGHIKQFQKYCKILFDKRNVRNKPVFLVGDLNINVIDYESNKVVKNFVDLCFQHGFIPIINKPTRVTKQNATAIDHIITNSLNSSISTGIIKCDVTDHFPVFVTSEVLISKMMNEQSTIYKRIINDKSIQNFKYRLSSINWCFLENISCTNKAYEQFLTIFSEIYNEVFPIKIIKVKNKDLLSPWITKGIRKSSKKKQKIYDKFLKCRSDVTLQKYKDYKNLFELVKRKSKCNYYNHLIETHKNNSRKTWNIMKEIIGKTKLNNNSFPKKIIINSQEVNNKCDIANAFNDFFVNVGPNLAKNIDKSGNNFVQFLNTQKTTLPEHDLTEEELHRAFHTLKLNKSTGYDDISANVVKTCYDELLFPLKFIFNKSIKTGVFPDKLKIAKVTPIFKSGESTSLTNYRPISILPCFSKLLERIMYNRLYNYLISNSILYKNQFGFQSSNSTEYAIMELVDQISNSFDSNKFTLGVFIDLSKAFDTVDHNIMLEKLKHYGASGNNLAWFKSYLDRRKQFIYFDQSKMNVVMLRAGIEI